MLRYLGKSWEVKRNMGRDKKEFLIALIREPEGVRNNYNFPTVLYDASVRNSLDNPVKKR